MWYCFSHILIKIQVKLQLLVRFLIVFSCKIVTKSKCYKYSSITRITSSSSKLKKKVHICKTYSISPLIGTSLSIFTQCTTFTHWYRSGLGTHWYPLLSSSHGLCVALEFPVLSTHWTQLVDLLGVQPFNDTVDMEAMWTFTPNWKRHST